MMIPLTYIEGRSFVHRADGRLKVVLLFAYSGAVLVVVPWAVLAPLLLAPFALALAARIPARALIAPLLPVAVLGLFAFGAAIAAHPDAQGLSEGLAVAARMVVLVAASMVVCLTTPVSQLLRAFRSLIGPLRRLGLPVDDIAFTLALAVRFMPLIAQELAMVRRAQRSRGGDMAGLGLMGKLRLWGVAFSAVLVGMFRHGDAIARAMDARCYGAASSRTALEDSRKEA